MPTYSVPELMTLIIGLLALVLGEFVCTRTSSVRKLSIPAPVVGGILTSLVVSIVEVVAGIKIDFATQLRDVLILLFFVSLGFTAKLGALRSGGRPLFYICVVTVLLLAMQNLVGIGVALAWGAHPYYGLLAGSISFVGGPGTALAWAKEASAMGLQGAELVAVSAATFAVSIGAVVSGPIVTWIVDRHKLRSDMDSPNGSATQHVKKNVQPAASSSSLIATFLIIALAVWLGNQLNSYAQLMNLLLPGFLCSLLAGMLITNLADVRRISMPLDITDRVGDLALQVFLAISLMSLKLSAIGTIIVPLAIVVLLQVVLSAGIAYLVLFRALGRDYDAAVATGGFLGFAVSSMPVAMATMEQIAKRYGAAPRAILLITLAGSFFVDLANAIIVKGFVALLPWFTP